MEEWQEEIEVLEPIFFSGKLTAKYIGEINSYLTDKDSQSREHYELSKFYEINISQIERIEKDDYDKRQKAFEINYFESINSEYKGEKFKLKPEKLSVLKGAIPDHIQYEDRIIHGHFIDIPVVFSVLKSRKRIVTKTLPVPNPNLGTGIGTPPIPPIGTGDPLDKKACIQGEPTGRTRRRFAWIEYEYYNSNCTTFWRKEKRINKPDDEPIGCLDVFGSIFYIFYLLAMMAIVIGLLISSGLFEIILLILIFGASTAAIGFLIKLLGKFTSFFVKGFSVISNLALLALVFLIFNGLYLFLDKSGSNKEDKARIESTSEDKKKISPPRPVPKEKVNPTENYDNTEYIDQIEVNLSWRALDGEVYQGSFPLNVPDIKSSYKLIRSIKTHEINSYASLYTQIINHDKHRLKGLYSMLDSIRTANNFSDRHFLDVIVSMVQAQEYVLVLDRSCKDPKTLSNRAIRNMLESGIKCEAIHPFGLKTPLEFLSDLTGDCDTRTVTLYTILKHYKYNVSIINSTHYEHSMLGIDIQGVRGSKKVFGKNNYYFWETTSKGFELGFLPHEINKTAFWEVVLN